MWEMQPVFVFLQPKQSQTCQVKPNRMGVFSLLRNCLNVQTLQECVIIILILANDRPSHVAISSLLLHQHHSSKDGIPHKNSLNLFRSAIFYKRSTLGRQAFSVAGSATHSLELISRRTWRCTESTFQTAMTMWYGGVYDDVIHKSTASFMLWRCWLGHQNCRNHQPVTHSF